MNESNPFQSPAGTDSTTPPPSESSKHKMLAFAAFAIVFCVLLYFSRNWLSLEVFAQQESRLQALLQSNPVLVFGAAFLLYVVVAGLSLPGGAPILSLVYAWFFKFWAALVLVSFASTAGATLAFLIARYFLRDSVQNRFGDRLSKINQAFEAEGAFYLFTLRLIPAVPFFATNLLMGLTKIKASTFWWVSQIGMLAGTAVYVYAGSSIPDLNTLQTEGVSAVFSASQITQFTIAFALLGCFPIVVKKIFGRFRKGQASPKAS